MSFEFKATKRVEQGTGASRRLRRAGQLPGIIYGAHQEAIAVTFDHNELFHLLRRDAFHSSVLNIALDGKKESVILRDAQWHPFKPLVLHIDFQRVDASEKLSLKVPLRFLNGEASPAVKLGGQMITHVINELDISCLPKDLPEFLEVDLSALENDQSLHVSDIQLPEGVELVQHGDANPVIATALKTGGGEEEDADDAEDGEAEEA